MLEKAKSLERSLYINLVNRAQAEWSNGHSELADRLLADCSLNRRGWEWYFTKKLCHSDLHTLRGHTVQVDAVAFNQDGRLVASVACDLRDWSFEPGELTVWETATGRTLFTRPRRVCCVAFTPDGEIAVGDTLGVITFYDAVTGQIARTAGTRRKPQPGFGTVLTRDGATFAMVGSDRLELWDAPLGIVYLTSRHRGRGQYITVALNPDGKTLAKSGAAASVDIWDVQTAKPIRTLRGPAQAIYALAFSPTG